MLRKPHRGLIAGLIGVLAFLALAAVAWAYAFEEYYASSGKICTNGCYIQNPSGGHTFVFNSGYSGPDEGEPYLACQLFNTGSENVVKNETGDCNVKRSNNGAYVVARVYNESGAGGEEKLHGWAHTN